MKAGLVLCVLCGERVCLHVIVACFAGFAQAQSNGARSAALSTQDPFPNGNGRTARVLGNNIAPRYGLPAFMRVRPRPGAAYAWVAHQAMEGNCTAAIPLFVRLYEAAL